MAAISAHRGGGEEAPAGTYQAYVGALEAGADYVEFDIRRTADGELAVYHDNHVGHDNASGHNALAHISYSGLCELAGYEVPRVADLMRLIAGHAIGHLDLKETGGEEAVIEQALDILGPGRFVTTTLEDASVAAIKGRFPDVPVGLSLGRDLGAVPRLLRPLARRREVFPLSRIRACGADWVAMHQGLALAGVLRRCRRQGIKTMIWTVNNDTMITRWLADPWVDVLVTDRPKHAITSRERLRGAPGPAKPRGS
ncbi:MAG TPA: glycerophosphodiester phosphodiesterase [Streptosporangiaceae bacterium]|nr:glycerophosphodiester phosphodiesterase [Streptosporangiaceae bacterium]